MPIAERDGVRIHYRDEGSGFAVVLHTGGAGDGAIWDGAGYTGELSAYRRLVMDHRGRGGSDRVPGVEAHHPDAYVADVLAVADSAGAGAFGFLGYSMGASVGYRLAATHPVRVAALVAIGGVAGDPGTADDPADLIGLLVDGGAPALTPALEQDEGIVIPGWLRRNFDATDAGQLVLSLRAAADTGDTVWDDLPRIVCPTALVAGALEAPPGSLERMRDAIPGGAAIARLDGLGHVGAFLDSDAVLQAAVPVLAAGRDRASR
jgi:pimeloyl-ACP methyl ester carboxylesterase